MDEAQSGDEPEAAFREWVEKVLRLRSLHRMIRPDVFDRAMEVATYLPDVLARQNNQTEFTLPIWDYLDIAASDERIRNGRLALRKHRDTFVGLERRFGVDPETVAAIWGLETGYGAIRGDTPVIAALATLAFAGKRAGFFEDELMCALRIVQSGHVRAEAMVGSWAGAMGHGQFMPSSFLDFAVDYDGDGRADIWARDPTDALASIAHYLGKHGWRSGQPWGYEVRLPDGFDYARIGLDQNFGTREWADMGVTMPDGAPLPDYGNGSVVLPAGARGVALMALRNFLVILRYNRAEAYAIGIGHLADRLAGAKGFVADWPDTEQVLDRDEISEAQVNLTALGFNTLGIDGKRGPNTTRAVREYQTARGLIADGYLSEELLANLRGERERD